MSFPNREDSIKRPVEGLSRCKGAKVASSISASKRSGNASCEVRGGRSTDDGKDSITLSEERVLAAHKTVHDGGELHSAVSMHGGTRIRRLEPFLDSLYQCAKADRQRVFHSLHDKLCSMEILAEAWRRVASNNGVAGIDSETIGDIRNAGAEQYLSTLQQELIDETYTVECVRRVYIPKPNGKQRPLGIPTVRDRIVQQAVKLLIEPIFEADFQEFSYGYRPNKSAQQASQEVYKYLNYGLTNIIDIDIEDFFGTIDHDRLISFVMERISDPYIIKLIREWLRAGVVYNGETTYPDMGTPQGGVISPLLANIYLNKLDSAWKGRKMDSKYRHDAHLIRYADDMCVLTDKEPSKAMAVIAELTDSLGLRLSPEKTRITTAQQGFDFLGFHFVRAWNDRRNKDVTYVYPSVKSVRKFRDKVRDIIPLTKSHVKSEEQVVRELNLLITGWSNYFNHSNASRAYNSLDRYIAWKAAKFYCKVHKIRLVSSRKNTLRKMHAKGLKRLSGRIRYVSRTA